MIVKSEMAGTLFELKTQIGQVVQKGTELCVLESMKMEVPVLSPVAGKIKNILKKKGEFINEGDSIFEIE